MEKERLTFHPVAEIFPMMEGQEFKDLVADISQNGLLEPIWLYDEQIIDGRNRYLACIENGIEPHFKELNGKTDLVNFVISMNLKRRHLDESQRALIAAKLANYQHGGIRKGQNTRADQDANLHGSINRDQAARLVNVSKRSIASASSVLQKGTAEVIQAVEDGKLAVSAASKLVTYKAEFQDAVIKKVAKGMQPKQAIKKVNAERVAKMGQVPHQQRKSDVYKLLCGDFRDLMASVKADVIITDPPYAKEYLPLFEDLSRLAAQVVKPGGLVVMMCGQSYLPKIHYQLEKHLQYLWEAAYETPGGQSAQLWQRRVNTFWKPLLIYCNGDYDGKWYGDVVKSEARDKRFHEWGQSESGMADIIERWTEAGDVVLDPFCGAGTTGVVAVQKGRRFIGIDKDQEAIDITRGRLVECLK